MIQMALHGEGEPQPTLLQVATQAATIELFTQWQTYRNGVHMDWDTFRSIDFRAIAVAVLTGAGFEVKAVEAATDTPKLRALLAAETPFAPETVVEEQARLVHAHALRALDEDPLGRTVTDGKVPSRTQGQVDVAARVAESRRCVAEKDAVTRQPHGFDHHTLDNVTLAGTSRRPYDLADDAIAEHAGQVQG